MFLFPRAALGVFAKAVLKSKEELQTRTLGSLKPPSAKSGYSALRGYPSGWYEMGLEQNIIKHPENKEGPIGQPVLRAPISPVLSSCSQGQLWQERISEETSSHS